MIFNKQKYEIFNIFIKEKHSLKFKNCSNDESLWISYDVVKNYIKQMHSLYLGTFGCKRGDLSQQFFKESEIPAKFTDIILEPVSVLGAGSSMCRYIDYKNGLILK